MPKQASSQWDFGGDLFPAEAMRRVFTVAELTTDIRKLIEQHVGQVWVSGEITNLRVQSSGHIYFTLKDANAQLNCVLFRADPVAGRDVLQDGRKVVLKGEMTVYEARGQYQLRVLAIELHGVGALQIAFEKLKSKLQAEGLFALERKRPLPRFPRRIGLVTSPTGAAIQDVLHVIERRNPSLEIIFVPCLVQGPGAAGDIVAAIRLLNEFHTKRSAAGPALDLILLTRGGGSLEDLWAFNEEVVARAIFHSALPVVSAVGHEIDFTIGDFVADLRAATPSAAAEILTEDVFASCRFISQVPARLEDRLRQRIARERQNFDGFATRLQRAHPRRRLNERLQRLDDLQLSMSRCVRHDLQKFQMSLRNLRERLGRLRPRQLVAQRRELLHQEESRLREQMQHKLRDLRHRCATLETQLHLLSPEKVLARGYSITMDTASGEVVRSAEQVHAGQKLKTKLKSGEIHSVAEP